MSNEDYTAFHQRIPIGTPCYFTDQNGVIHRATVAGGKQVCLGYNHTQGHYKTYNLAIYLETAPESMTYHLESELNFYLEGRWMTYKEAMLR